MTGLSAAPTVPTDSDTKALSIRRPLLVTDNEFDRCPELRGDEAAALTALSPLEMRRNRACGVPRRTAQHWTALARLVEPLDATRAILHHLDDVYYQRAGAHAVAVVLQHCAATGRAYWEWSAWDWASVCGASSQAFRAAQPLPTETMVRPFVMALA